MSRPVSFLMLVTKVIGLAAILLALLILIGKGYQHHWTGFGERIEPSDNIVPARTLWDWLDLLIVPVVLALGAFFLEGSRKRAEENVEQDRQRQQVLDAFFDYVSELTLADHLGNERPNDRARELVRTRALAALRLLDEGRKSQLPQFLRESGLIARDPIVRLLGANLTGADLSEATLQGSTLRGIYFSGASFRGANLRGADFSGSDFSGADFSDADLRDVRFVQANLEAARFHRAKIEGADFEGANLSDTQPPINRVQT